MKTNPWHAILLALLAVNAAGTGFLAWQYVRSMQTFQQLQQMQGQVSYELRVFRSLLAESVEYGKTNQAILPVLQSLGVNPRSTTAPENAPNANLVNP